MAPTRDKVLQNGEKILSVHMSIRLPFWSAVSYTLRTICKGLRACWRGLRACKLGLRVSQQDLMASQQGFEGQPEGGRTEFFPHFTGLCPLSGPLPCYSLQLHHINKAGQGYRYSHDAFRRFFASPFLGLRYDFSFIFNGILSLVDSFFYQRDKNNKLVKTKFFFR